MQYNGKDNTKDNGTKWRKTNKTIQKIPKIIKYGIILFLIIELIFWGVLLKQQLIMQTKSTKLGLEDVGELVTQTCYVTVVQDTKVNRDFFNLFDVPFTESRQIFSYDIEVDASVNFSEISYHESGENEITIKLPHAKIYKSSLNLFSFKEYLDATSWFSRVKLENQNEALKSMEEQAVADAKANGILEEADKNAQMLISGLVKSNPNYKDYKINYEYIGG